MGVELDDEEVWDFLRTAHTAILSTNGSDGWPIALPLWLVVEDRTMYFRTMAASATARRLARDPRVCVTAESGHAWRELRAVVVPGEARLHDDPGTLDRVEALLAAKYDGYRRPASTPAAVERHYDRPNVVIAVTPSRPVLSWDNSKIRSRPAPAAGSGPA
jgi:PPOX class probable F420-dependent enzyme